MLENGLIKFPAYSGLFINRYSLNTSLNLFTMLETASLLLELETNVRSSGRKWISCLEWTMLTGLGQTIPNSPQVILQAFNPLNTNVTIKIIHAVHAVSYTHLRAHETRHDLVCRLLLELIYPFLLFIKFKQFLFFIFSTLNIPLSLQYENLQSVFKQYINNI